MVFSLRAEQTLSLISSQADNGLDLDIAAFLTDCQVRALSPNTLRIYRKQLAAFQDWTHNKPAHAITTQDLRLYSLHLQASHNAGGQHQAYRVLHTFFAWLVAEEVLASNPMQRLKPPQVKDDPLPPVSIDDVKALLGVCRGRGFLDLRDTALMLFLLDTGARASEALAVNLADVDLHAGTVILRTTKNGHTRVTFVGAQSRKRLLAYLRTRRDADSNAPLWVTDEGKRLTYAGLRQILRRRAAQAGIEEPSAHAFRRAFCLGLLRGGADVFAVQRLAGHADLATTRRYVRQVEADLQAAHSKASVVDKLLR